MHPIEIIYITLSSLSVFTSLPQVRQLWIMKSSEEFNLFTWVTWFIAQISALAYSIYIKSIAYTAINLMWIVFYITVLALIVKYRQPKQLDQQVAVELSDQVEI